MSLTVTPDEAANANVYAAGPLDRADRLRGDPDWLARALKAPETLLVPVWRNRNLVLGEAGAPEPVFLPGTHPATKLARTGVFLGLRDGAAVFALDLSHHADPPLGAYGVFQDLRAFGPLIDADTGAILATARALVHWHDRGGHCPRCGAENRAARGGWRRDCVDGDCATQVFPRIDPAVIVLVHDGADRVILGRQAIWPPGMHSVLAGFVEPGESLEDTVAREVFEEVGVRVAEIAYHSSQPWPFPQSLMLGFFARTADDALKIDTDELESARWFTRADLAARGEGGAFRLPRRDSIARRLLADWLGR